MATLYDMTSDARRLYEMLDNGDIDEETVKDTLEAIGVEDKLEDYCKVIRQFEADATALKAEKANLAEKQARAERRAEEMKERVLAYLIACGACKAKAGLFEVRISKSKAVEIQDEKLLPDEYLIQQPPKVDKMRIKDAISRGVLVSGASIKENQSLRIK